LSDSLKIISCHKPFQYEKKINSTQKSNLAH